MSIHLLYPLNSNENEIPITLSVDEYETLRLIDKEGFSQEHTEQFKVYTIEDGKVIMAEVIDTDGQGHN